MKIKIILSLVCLLVVTLFLVGCKDNEDEKKPCDHSFTEGVCVNCGESDPSYKPSTDSGNGGNDNSGNQGGEDGDNQNPVTPNPDTPSEDLGGNLHMPFVPAK